jgi:[FeFe] hydrogenase H-cluster maturation GTPase HydF
VLFIDTAGIDDPGALGRHRVEKTRAILERTDVALLIVESGQWGPFEESLLDEFARRDIPRIVVLNKSDLAEPDEALLARFDRQKTPWVKTVAPRSEGMTELREALIRAVPDEFLHAPPIVSDLVGRGELAVLVVPIDNEAPKGRLILPQVQTLRDLLDGGALSMVVKETELRDALGRLKRPPALVVTDSQAFARVAADTPSEIPMTSFSILFARQKGDFLQLVEGTRAIERLRPGDRVLVAEACTHHPVADDIGREKIPRWLRDYVGGELEFTTTGGMVFPDDLARYRLVVHCGGCMLNRREVLSRLLRCRQLGVPVTNYGMAIAYTLGLFDRAMAPFPEFRWVGRRPAGAQPFLQNP